MAEERVQRRLAAIVAADVVGFSRMMAADEAATLARLKALRAELFDPKTAHFGGRIFKNTGDGALAEFSSAVDAVQSAVVVQRELAARNAALPEDQQVHLRIGISLGDVLVDGDDLYGNGVNIAARMETLAEPDGICVSGNVHEHVGTALDISFDDVGEKLVKGLVQPVRCYRVIFEAGSASSPHRVRETVTDRPSIAVLPFVNMSGDPEQEFFADGMAEDIITGLSKFSWLFVIARNSSFTYKGRAVDVRAVAHDLGVRYVLEGSVRRGGNRIRVTGQLIDAETGNHLWADRYERELDDLFEVQDEVTAAIVAAIAPEIGHAEIERAKRKPPESLDAWALYQRGLELYPSGAARDFEAAIDLFDSARKTDSNFVDALVMAAHMRTRYAHFHNPEHRNDLLQEARVLLDRAMRLDSRHSTCHAAMGRLHVVLGEPEIGLPLCQDAVALNPNSILANMELAIALRHMDRDEEALQYLATIRRLSPRDPHAAAVLTTQAAALFMLDRFEECADVALKCSRSANPRHWNDAILVAALAKLGRTTEMEEAQKVLLSRRPGFTISQLRLGGTLGRKLPKILRESGLPE